VIDAELAVGGAHHEFLPSGALRDPGLATGLRDVVAALVDVQPEREPEPAASAAPAQLHVTTNKPTPSHQDGGNVPAAAVGAVVVPLAGLLRGGLRRPDTHRTEPGCAWDGSSSRCRRPIRVWAAGPAKVMPMSPQGSPAGLSPRIGSQ
jgi:hypothetical protein